MASSNAESLQKCLQVQAASRRVGPMLYNAAVGSGINQGLPWIRRMTCVLFVLLLALAAGEVVGCAMREHV